MKNGTVAPRPASMKKMASIRERGLRYCWLQLRHWRAFRIGNAPSGLTFRQAPLPHLGQVLHLTIFATIRPLICVIKELVFICDITTVKLTRVIDKMSNYRCEKAKKTEDLEKRNNRTMLSGLAHKMLPILHVIAG